MLQELKLPTVTHTGLTATQAHHKIEITLTPKSQDKGMAINFKAKAWPLETPL